MVANLRVNESSQNEILKHLSKQLDEHKHTMEILTETINRSRGALAAIGFVATLVGTIGGWLAHIFVIDKH